MGTRAFALALAWRLADDLARAVDRPRFAGVALRHQAEVDNAFAPADHRKQWRTANELGTI